MSNKRFFVPIIISAFIILAAGFAIYVVIGVGKGTIRLGNSNVREVSFVRKDNELSSSGKWNEGIIEYNGEKYIYKSGIRTYLIMGVDREGPATAAENYVSGGQSDVMFLLVVDKSTQSISVIPINRNTMTKIRLCDPEGNYYGTFTAQICLQHGYGDGLKGSCQKSVEAVSKLFYDIPITGYMSFNMDAMSILNRLAGGVTLEVAEDIDYPDLDVRLTKGETVTLTDDEAYAYIRYRDVNDFGTANRRLEREKQYALAAYNQLTEIVGGDRSKAIDMFKELEPYVVTNMVFGDLAADLIKYGFDSSKVFDIPGELVQGKKYEEFYVDKSALYDIILSVLYKNAGEN